jgi:DedD protein
MADPIADNADLAVDDLKRKARRRLIGAVVLALAAATLLPLLLEQEQKPLGDEVSVQIPPVDDGRFVSRLNADKGKDAQPGSSAEGKGDGKPAAKADVKPEPAADAKADPKDAAKSEAKAGAGPEAKSETDAKAGAKAEPKPAVKAEPKAAVKAEPKADAKAKAKAEPKAEAKAEPKAKAEPEANADARPAPAPGAPAEPTPAAAAAKSALPAAGAAPQESTPASLPAAGADAARPKVEGYIVQLGAFTDAYGANALSNRLKRAGYPAYTEAIDTSRGTLWRVRVGGYPSRAAAVEARDRLKADGHNGIVSAAK